MQELDVVAVIPQGGNLIKVSVFSRFARKTIAML
jgi:hypothetical protein